MAIDDFDADLADVTEDGYDTNLDAFGPGSGRGEDVGYRGTGEGTYDAGSDSYYMPSRSNIINSDNYDVGFAMNDQLSRGLSGDVFDPAKVQQYNQIAAGFSSEPLNISNQQIMNNSAMLREQGKGLEDIRIDFVKELGSKEGNAAFGNFLSGAFNVSKMGPYSDPMKTSDIGAFGVGLSSLMGDKTANYPMNNYDLVDLAMKQGNFALSGRDPSEFGSLGGIANQFGRDVSAGAKQVTNQLLSLADGAMSYLSNQGKAGDTVENIVAEQRGKEIAQLEKERLEQGLNKDFKTSTFPSITKTNLDPAFVNLPPDPVMVNQIQRDIAKSRGIFDLPQAADLQNQQIAAGTNAGKTLNPELPVSFPYGRSGGYNMSVLSSRGDAAKPNPIQGPPNPFVNDIVSPISRPFATTDEVALQRGTDGYYFANASNRKLDIPERISNFTFPTLTEAQVRASDDAGYSFEPTTNLATLGLQRDNTEFIEKANLPPELQGIVGLNTDLDYGQTTPLSVLLENTPLAVTARNRALKKEQEKKDKEIAEAEAFRKFRASLSPSTRIGGGYGGVNEPVRPNYSSSFTPSLPPLY